MKDRDRDRDEDRGIERSLCLEKSRRRAEYEFNTS